MVEKKQYDTERRGGGCLRPLFYVGMILFFVVAAAGIFAVVSGLNATRSGIIEPVGDLFRQISIEATAEIVPDPQIIVQEVSKLARLETASVSLNQVVTAERNSEFLWGAFGESLIFIAYGDVVAGVDLAEMSPEDVQVVDPDTVMIHLPEPAVFNPDSVLNTELSYIANRDEGFFADADPQLETAVRKEANAQLLAAGLEMGVLNMAEENAREYMTEFLNGLGFEEVVFTDGPPPPAPPYDQEIPKGFVVTPAAP